ncbi:MAG: hypothetical protein ACRDN9_13690 [Streptosporangiaceae bacterium]
MPQDERPPRSLAPWARADDAVRELRLALAQWRGREAARSVRWYQRGVGGEPSEEVVSLALTVGEAEALARLLVAPAPPK